MEEAARLVGTCHCTWAGLEAGAGVGAEVEYEIGSSARHGHFAHAPPELLFVC